MRKLLSGLVLASLPLAPAFAGPVEDYETWREEVWQATLDSSPGLATSVGDRRGDGKLGDMSLAAYEAQVEEVRAFLARLNAIDADELPVGARVGSEPH